MWLSLLRCVVSSIYPYCPNYIYSQCRDLNDSAIVDKQTAYSASHGDVPTKHQDLRRLDLWGMCQIRTNMNMVGSREVHLLTHVPAVPVILFGWLLQLTPAIRSRGSGPPP